MSILQVVPEAKLQWAGGVLAWTRRASQASSSTLLQQVSWLWWVGERTEQGFLCQMSREKKTGSGDCVEEESDKAQAAWFTFTKTQLCACVCASHQLRPGKYKWTSEWMWTNTITCGHGEWTLAKMAELGGGGNGLHVQQECGPYNGDG